MRALCGSIMAAGAFIGLGLAAVGIGMRYQSIIQRDNDNHIIPMDWHHVDPALMVIIVVLLIAALVGVGVAFVGLMYHHERRHNEMLHLKNQPHNGHTAPRIQV